MLWHQVPNCHFYICHCWAMDLSVLYSRRGGEGRAASTRSHCKASNTGRAVADVLYLMCVRNSIKPLSLKPGGGWLIFFKLCPGVLSLWAAEWHSSYCCICASGFYFVPVQNNKNIQVCLFAGLVWAKMNRYRASFIGASQQRAQVVLGKSWVLLGSLFRSYSPGDALLADAVEIKRTLQSGLYRAFFFSVRHSIWRRHEVGLKCNSLNTTSFFRPLPTIYSKTSHCAIQIYKLTKEDFRKGGKKNPSALWKN